MSFYISLKDKWRYLIGDPSSFSLENRIYNGFCLVCLLAIAINIPINIFYLDFAVSAFLLVILFIILAYLYYLARIRKKFNVSIIATGILILVVFPFNYLYNAGIAGPTLITFLLALFFLLAISPKSQYHIWYGANLLIVISLLLIEFFNPDSIKVTYPDRISLFIDNGSTYLILSFLLYFGVSFIKNNYVKARISAEEKAISLNKLNDEKTKLFSIISHDLRAPLGTIQQYLEFLLDLDLTDTERNKLKKELLIITKNTQEMLTNLLSWSTSQMNGTDIAIGPMNVLQTLSPTLELHKIIADKKGLTLIYDINESIKVKANPEMLQLVIRNLLNNAIKFTPKGGKINVKAFKEENNCLISIKDTGYGISEARQSNIFDLTSKSTTGTENEKGVGLGLVLCKDFIQAQNGRIWVKSIEGKGSTFTISIPSDI
jgi:two-component system sensor histidine kinase/response regulator